MGFVYPVSLYGLQGYRLRWFFTKMALDFKNIFVQKTNQSVFFNYKPPCNNEILINRKKPVGIFCLSDHSNIRT